MDRSTLISIYIWSISFCHISVGMSQNLQIQAQPSTVNIGQDEFLIVCSTVNPRQLISISTIQLQKNVTSNDSLQNVVSISLRNGHQTILWQDTSLQERATAIGTLNPPSKARLQFNISKDSIRCPEDFTGYTCSMTGLLLIFQISARTINQMTNQMFVSFTAQPALIEIPRVWILGSRSDTVERQFEVGTVLQLKCTGEIGSNASATIRWCAKTASASDFNELPQTPVHSTASLSGCQYTRFSTVTYNLTCGDTFTQFLCESGYDSHCESGTARQYLNISAVVSRGEHTRVSSECDSTNFIVSIVVSFLIVIIGSLVNIIICRRNRKNSCSGRKSSESHMKIKTVQEMLPKFSRSDRSPYSVLGPLEQPNTYDDLHLYVEPVS